MRRREFIGALGAVVTWPLAARAQERGRTYRLGTLSPSPRSAAQMVALFEELQRSGFTDLEGKR